MMHRRIEDGDRLMVPPVIVGEGLLFPYLSANLDF